MKPRTLVLVAIALLLVGSTARAEKKVLMVSIDGCRPDALQLATTPHVDALIAAGSVSYDGRNILDYGGSGPNYSSMLTGVNWPKHGVTDNSFSGSHFDVWLNMYERLETFDPSLNTSSFAGWGPINSGTWTDHFADETGELGDTGNRDRIADMLTTEDPDVLFWQISVVDSAGHSSGFDPTSTAYLNAIATADAYYGTILDALYARPGYIDGSEEWLILTVTDHGGYGTSHHSEDAGLTDDQKLQMQRTFYVATGPGAAVGADIGQPRVYDVAVTAMEYMGLDTSGLDLDGVVVMPEPATLSLLALGGALLLRRRRA